RLTYVAIAWKTSSHLLDYHLLQNHIVIRLVLTIARGAHDLLEDILPFHQFAEDGVLAREPLRRRNSDEELRAVGVRASVSHRQFARFVEIMRRAFGFVFELISGPPEAGSGGVASLDHETWDDAMENRAVIESIFAFLSAHRMRPVAIAFSQVDKVSDGLGSVFCKQAADDSSF